MSVEEQEQSVVVPMTMQQLLRIAGAGALLGVIAWGLAPLLDTYIFSRLCQGAESVKCASSFEYASAAAGIIAAALGLFTLVKLRVFRSLLVVLAATSCLWGLQTSLHAWSWQLALLASLLLYMIAYSAFAWLVRIRSFALSVISIVVLIVVVRLIFNS